MPIDEHGARRPTAVNATVLVTGSNGFVGATVARTLANAFAEVRGGTRRSLNDIGHAAPQCCRYVACDLDAPEQICRAVAGANVVVHAAYAKKPDVTQEQFRRLLEAMTAEGVDNIVHLSSIAIYGDREGRVDESMSATASLSGYARGKLGCEQLVGNWIAASTSRRRRAIVLRPGIIYGTGSEFWIDKLGERIRSGAWGTFGSRGEGDAALVHVDDVAETVTKAAMILACPNAAQLPQVVAANVVGPEQRSWNSYFSELTEAMGCPPLRELAPSDVAWRQGIAVAAKVWRRLGLPGARAFALAPTRDEMKLFGLKAVYLTDTAERLLGAKPRLTLKDGLARTRLPVHPVGASGRTR